MLTFKAGSHPALASTLTEIKILPANGFKSNICVDSIFQVINLTIHGYSQFRFHVRVKHVFPNGACLYLSIKPSMPVFFNSFLLFFSSSFLEFYFVMHYDGHITKKGEIDMTIKIVTKLNEGIADKFAGVQRVHHEFSTGPRNFLKAVETLITHRKKMENCYGNIGCGSSWIIIDGVAVDEHIINDYFSMLDFSNMTKSEYAQQFGHHVEKPTRTKWAEKTLSDFIKNNQSQKPIII